LNDVVNLLSRHQSADALQVAVAAANEEHLLDNVVVIHCYVNHFRAGSLRHILCVFHNDNVVLACKGSKKSLDTMPVPTFFLFPSHTSTHREAHLVTFLHSTRHATSFNTARHIIQRGTSRETVSRGKTVCFARETNRFNTVYI
jgi:hypothetical protein